MERTAILHSVAIRFFTFQEPRPNSVFVRDIVDRLSDRYRFWEVPQRLSDFDLDKGAQFSYGRFENANIDRLQIFRNGFMAEGSLSTNLLDAMLDDMLHTIGSEIDLQLVPVSPVQRRYNSTLEFRSELISFNIGKFDGVARMLDRMVAGYGISAKPFGLPGVSMHSDPSAASPFAFGPFKVERRQNQPFESALFFSEAPVSTEQHEELLAEFERSF